MSNDRFAQHFCRINRVGSVIHCKIVKTYCGEVMILLTVLCLLSVSIRTQTFAIVDPERTQQSRRIGKSLLDSLSGQSRVLDLDLAESVFRARLPDDPYNMDTLAASELGTAIGSRFFVILKTDVVRRSSFDRNEYYEAYAVYSVVSSLTGRLVLWKMGRFEEDSVSLAEQNLLEAVSGSARQIFAAAKSESSEVNRVERRDYLQFDQASEGTTPAMPYKRIKPVYTQLADYYRIAATVDILVDIDEAGMVRGTEIVRWAGYGLNESVTEAVLKMNWRPGEQKGRSLPMRVLLRYNFRDLEQDGN